MRSTINKRLAWCTPVLFALLLFSAACNKQLSLNNWAPNYLGPLVNGYATVEEICDLRNKVFTQNITAGAIGSYNTGTTYNIPALDIAHVGPYLYGLSDFFQNVYVDSAEFDITVQNAFPITISKGTHIIFRNSADVSNAGNIVLDYRLSTDIQPGATASFDTLIRNTYVSDTLYMYLDSFQSQGATNATFNLTPTQITFKIVFLNVFKVSLNVNKGYTIVDTTSFQLQQNISNYNDSAATGLIKVFLSNTMPVNFNFQLYFLDASESVLIDSLDHNGQMSIPFNLTHSDGTYSDSTYKEFDIPLSASRVSLLKSAKFIAYRLNGNTNNYPQNPAVVGNTCFMHILITGNLKILVGNFISL